MTVYTSDSNPYSTHDVFADSAVISNGVVVFRIDSEILENVKFVDRGDYVSLDSDGSVAGYGISYEDGFIKFDSVDDVNYPLYGKYPGLKATYYSITNLKYRDEDADVDDEDSIVVVEPGDVDKDIKIVPYSDDDDVLVFAKDSDDDTISLELAEDELIIYDSRRSWAGMIGVTEGTTEAEFQYAVPRKDYPWPDTYEGPWTPGSNKYPRIRNDDSAYIYCYLEPLGTYDPSSELYYCDRAFYRCHLSPVINPEISSSDFGHTLIVRARRTGKNGVINTGLHIFDLSLDACVYCQSIDYFFNPDVLGSATIHPLRSYWQTLYLPFEDGDFAGDINDYSRLYIDIRTWIDDADDDYGGKLYFSHFALKVPGVE